MSPELAQLAQDLLEELPWSIVLPAGCGKTELIAAIAASIDQNSKPLLILTHTNAGVDVVRKRLSKYRVKSSQARVFTLDTWAKLFDDHFPSLGGTATVPSGTNEWTGIRLRAKTILENTNIGDIIKATYKAVIVDEYQDCSDLQHEIVVQMSQYLPVGIVGDPLQGIFDFGEGVVDWEQVVAAFNPKEITPIPHRWVSRNPALGAWLIDLRQRLEVGEVIDLVAEGVPVTWQQSTVDLSSERSYCLTAATSAGNQKQVLILRPLPEQCHNFARQLMGRFNVAEEIELKVAHKLLKALDDNDNAKAAGETLKFMRACCRNYDPVFNPSLVRDYSNGREHTFRANNSHASAFEALNKILTEPTPQNVKKALSILGKVGGVNIYRKEAWNVVMQVLDEVVASNSASMSKLQDVRNQRRYSGRNNSRHVISRTLLVKGQEYDECIIIGADAMSIRNLYVALSRGVDKVTVFSSSSRLTLTLY